MSAPRRVRLREPLGAMRNGRVVIVPAGVEGVVADRRPEEYEGTFAVIIDDLDCEYDSYRCPDVVEVQVEDVEP